jgi:hypothetical protein
MQDDKALLLLLDVVPTSPHENEQILLVALGEDHSAVLTQQVLVKSLIGNVLSLGGFSLGQMTDCHVKYKIRLLLQGIFYSTALKIKASRNVTQPRGINPDSLYLIYIYQKSKTILIIY